MLHGRVRRWGAQGLVGASQKPLKKQLQSSQEQKGQRSCYWNAPVHLEAGANSKGRAAFTNQIPGTSAEQTKIKLATF